MAINYFSRLAKLVRKNVPKSHVPLQRNRAGGLTPFLLKDTIRDIVS